MSSYALSPVAGANASATSLTGHDQAVVEKIHFYLERDWNVKVLGFVKFCEPSSIFTQYLRVGIYIGRCKGTMCSKKRWDLPTAFSGM